MTGPIQLRTQKGLLTRYTNTLIQLVEKFSENINSEQSPRNLTEMSVELSTSLTIVEDALQKFATVVDQIDTPLTEEQDIQVKEYISKTEVALEAAQKLCIQIQAKKAGVQQPATTPTSSSIEIPCAKVELPTIPIPVFNGKIEDFENFWALFSANVHNLNLSNLQKFNYLLRSLKGEAKEVVGRYPVTEENYENAVKALQLKFGDRSKLINHLQGRLERARARGSNIEEQRKLLDYIMSLTIQLDYKGIKLNGSYLGQKILSKFLPDIQRKVLKQRVGVSSEEGWSLNSLLTDLDTIISTEEKVKEMLLSNEAFQNHKRLDIDKKPTQPAKIRQISCLYCNLTNHISLDCKKIATVKDRIDFLLKGKRCLNCTRTNHLLKDCTAKGCGLCEGNKHHYTICPKRQGDRKPQVAYKKETYKQSGDTKRSSDHPKKTVYRQNCATTDEVEKISLEQSDATTTLYTSNNGLSGHGSSATLLTGTAIARSNKTGKVHEVEILLDTGADKSFINQELADELELPTKERVNLSIYTFGSKKPKCQVFETTALRIWDVQGNFYDLSLCKTDVITGNPKQIHLTEQDIKFLQDKKIILSNNKDGLVNPQILIGCDHLWPILNTSNPQYVLPSGLYAIPSRLGYLLSGCQHREITLCDDAHINTVDEEELEQWDKFWALDSAGVEEFTGAKYAEKMTINAKVRQFFNETVEKRPDGYYVRLPFKENRDSLPSNKTLAYRRLLSVYNTLKSNSELLRQYDSIFQEQLQLGILEEVSETSEIVSRLTHYLPHQPVITPLKETTKLRIVYDASSHLKGCCSLNDLLHQGPLILPNLYGMLLRFRTTPYVAISDVEKAFLQIRLNECDRDVTRCLWLKDISKGIEPENIATYRFTRVTFGLNVSPFLLAATIRYHIEREVKDVSLACEISENLYVDNLILAGDSTNEILNKALTARNIFSDMKMNLREFLTNNQTVQERLPSEICAKTTKQKVLGLTWNSEKDTLTIECKIPATPRVTKRIVAQQIASIYDPLGWLVPLLVPHKQFQQKIWKEGCAWDQELSQTLSESWAKIRENSNAFCKVLRREVPVRKPVNLAVFADASEIAMAACAYAFGNGKSSLLMAKSKLPSIKSKTTIPKLEMNAITMATRLALSVTEAIHRPAGPIENIFIFSDSQIVLSWLEKSGKKMGQGVLVENRIKEIREILQKLNKMGSNVSFGYVPTTINPADAGTRGLSKESLEASDWWTGPEFLSNPISTWSSPLFKLPDSTYLEENHDTACAFMAIDRREEISGEFPLHRFSTLQKAIRVMGWILRFLKNSMTNLSSDLAQRIQNNIPELSQEDKKRGPLTGAEIQQAKAALIKNHQRSILSTEYKKSREKLLKLFEDSAGLWRVRGRLGKSSLDNNAKFPIFVASKTDLASLIIKDAHGTYHKGVAHTMATVRENFWIPKLRQQVRTLVQHCTKCKRFNGLPYRYPEMTDVPARRVQQTRPFEHIGLDFFDLPSIRESGELHKCYGCIFTCAVTRMIHLEMLQSMSCEAFLNALRRFFSRRGIPSTITCDNAPTFLLSANILQSAIDSKISDFVSNKAIEWINITPYAPWQGGFYERLIKSIKNALYKAIGRAKLSCDNMITILTEVEATLNTRPLTYQESNCEELHSVRPIDFIQKNVDITFPFDSIDNDIHDQEYHPLNKIAALETRSQAITALQSSVRFTDQFWKLWRELYLNSLREQHRTRLSQSRYCSTKPETGSLVLVTDPLLPRNEWKMARITDLRENSEGEVREVEMVTAAKRKIKRPVNLVVPLELYCDESPAREGQIPETDQTGYNLRPRKPVKYREGPVEVSSNHVSIKQTSFLLTVLTLLSLSTSTKCGNTTNSVSIECHRNGVLIRNRDVIDLEVCLEDECKSYSNPKLVELVRFSSRQTLHEHSVLIKWRSNTTSSSIETTCNGLDFCENIQCTLCTEAILNPECWPMGSLLGLAFFIYCCIALIYVLLYVPITLGKPLRLILKALFIIAQHIICFSFYILRRILRFRPNTSKEIRLRNLAEALAIFAICRQVNIFSQACQDVSTFETESLICTSLSSTRDTCEISISDIMKINSYKQEACLHIRTNSTPSYRLKLRWKGLNLYCDHETISYSRDIKLHVSDSKRCPHMGSCVGDKCAAVKPQDLLPELDLANHYPGRTGCWESCGGLGCDCFYPSSGCLFYRIYAMPVSDTVFEISRCMRWQEEVKLEVTTEHLGKTLHYVEPIIPNVPLHLRNFTITMTSLTLPPLPILGQKFISDGTQFAIWRESDISSLTCNSSYAAKNLSCDLQDDCKCSPAEYKIRCTCKTTSIGDIFDDISRKLPINIASVRFLPLKNTQVMARVSDTMSAEFIVNFHGTLSEIRQEVRKSTCSIENAMLRGCYRCKKGAEAIITCKSAQPSLGEIKCDRDTFVVSCSPSGTTSTLRFWRNKARNHLNCSLMCAGTSYFMISGILKFISPWPWPVQKAISSDSSEKPLWENLQWPDFIHIGETLFSWQKTIIFLVIILTLALAITYLYLPTVLNLMLRLTIRAITTICLRLPLKILRVVIDMTCKRMCEKRVLRKPKMMEKLI